jgi:hypothetical protein
MYEIETFALWISIYVMAGLCIELCHFIMNCVLSYCESC